MYKLNFKKSAFAELKRLPKQIQLRIDDALQLLVVNPWNSALNVKKLKGFDALYRLRVGDYRVLYEIARKELYVTIVRVGHRKDVYG